MSRQVRSCSMAWRSGDTNNAAFTTPYGVTVADQGPIYICHCEHEHDRTYSENLVEYLSARGTECRVIEFAADGLRPGLEDCLGSASAILGFNSQLDHSWLNSGNFVAVAAERGIPVIQWILDHPS